MTRSHIVNGYCVVTTVAIERTRFDGDIADPTSKVAHAVKVTDGALALSQFRNDAVRSAGGEQLLGSRLHVEVSPEESWNDWLISADNQPELVGETCALCKQATADLVWADVREGT